MCLSALRATSEKVHHSIRVDRIQNKYLEFPFYMLNLKQLQSNSFSVAWFRDCGCPKEELCKQLSLVLSSRSSEARNWKHFARIVLS
jgi:hypothetical protein